MAGSVYPPFVVWSIRSFSLNATRSFDGSDVRVYAQRSMGTDGSRLRVNMVICGYMFVNSGTWTFARNRYYSTCYFFRICVFRGTSFAIGSWYLLVKAWIKKDCSCGVLINLFVQRLRCFIVGIYVLFVEACVSTMRREKDRMYYDSK